MRFSKLKKFTSISIFLVLFLSPVFAWGAMLSDSYVIYENIHHDFDGPVISAVASSVSGLEATVTWTTNVVADSFVVYSTDSALPLATSMERGTSLKNNTSHSVALSRLAPNTTYYFRVKSTRTNGGTSVSSSINSFAIGADPDAVVPVPVTPQSGGGVLIIDKTDKIAPIITELKSEVLGPKSVKISWKTNENATSFIEYGKTSAFGSVFGLWDNTTTHEVTIINLDSDSVYQYRAISSDSWGNLGQSDTQSFTLLPDETEENKPDKPDEPIAKPDEPKILPDPVTETTIINNITENTLAFLRKLFPEVSLNEITNDQLKGVENLIDMTELIAPPLLSGKPEIVVEDTKATISWITDIDSNSQIAFAPEDMYKPNALEPYYQIVGDAEEMVKDHKVEIYGLTADTAYHFQLRSKPRIGPTAVSRDYTFATSLETLTIVSFFSQVISPEEAVFKWVTNKDADTTLKYSPYDNNVVAIDKQKVVKDNKLSVIHEITLADLESGVYYDIELTSVDALGNQAVETLLHFTTSEDDLPPLISQVKAESTVFLDKSNKTQTIMSWITNEPTTGRVYYQEGVHGGQDTLAESTDLNSNYSKEHIMVITKFKPGIVYSFRVESIDSGGSTTLSPVHTFMTAKQKESIIQIIMGIFENTFSWVKKLM